MISLLETKTQLGKQGSIAQPRDTPKTSFETSEYTTYTPEGTNLELIQRLYMLNDIMTQISKWVDHVKLAMNRSQWTEAVTVNVIKNIARANLRAHQR